MLRSALRRSQSAAPFATSAFPAIQKHKKTTKQTQNHKINPGPEQSGTELVGEIQDLSAPGAGLGDWVLSVPSECPKFVRHLLQWKFIVVLTFAHRPLTVKHTEMR